MTASTLAPPRPERRLGAALAALEAAQKPGAGVPAYTRWINRRLARGVVAVAYVAGLTPNAITVLSAVASAAGLVVLVSAEPTPIVGLVVATLLAAGYLLDSADGQLARLSGGGSRAGEWLDHVVDAIRSPAIHLAVAGAVLLRTPEHPPWLAAVAGLFALVVTGQFMSQILGEQLRRASGAPAVPAGGGTLRSWLLLPSDMGTTCWIFALWGVPAAFAVGYSALLFLLLLHTAVSMSRRYRELRA